MNAEPLVTLVRRQFDGTVRKERLHPADAVGLLLNDVDNGLVYSSGHILWGDVLDNWPMAADFPARGNHDTSYPGLTV